MVAHCACWQSSTVLHRHGMLGTTDWVSSTSGQMPSTLCQSALMHSFDAVGDIVYAQ